MTNEEIYNKINDAVTTECCKGESPSTFRNALAQVLYEGEFMARLDGLDWVDGEGYPSGRYDAILKGIRHNLKVEYYPRPVHEFFNNFL